MGCHKAVIGSRLTRTNSFNCMDSKQLSPIHPTWIGLTLRGKIAKFWLKAMLQKMTTDGQWFNSFGIFFCSSCPDFPWHNSKKPKKNIKYDRPTSTFHRFPTVPASQVGVADAVFDLLECHLHSVKFEHSGEELVICRLTYIYIINYIYILYVYTIYKKSKLKYYKNE